MKYKLYWLLCVVMMQACALNDDGKASNDDIAWGCMILGIIMFFAGLEHGAMMCLVGAVMFLIGCN